MVHSNKILGIFSAAAKFLHFVRDPSVLDR
jgi:hypothetical protein